MERQPPKTFCLNQPETASQESPLEDKYITEETPHDWTNNGQQVKACSPVSSASIIGFSPASTFSTIESLATLSSNDLTRQAKRNSPPLRERPLYANKRIFIRICLREIHQAATRQDSDDESNRAGENSQEDGQSAGPSSSSRNTSSSASMLMATTAMPEFESIDGMDEECFTLEPFESLIQNASRTNKEFILARVATADPSEPNKHYYSYYAAYQINKVLFRTQPSEGLLHRMKARNPLNNMPIVGDVYYFAISPVEVQRAWDNPQEGSPGSSSANAAFLPAQPSSSDSQQSGSSDNRPTKIVYRAKFVGTDDNFLMISSFREYFKQNSMNPDDFTLFTLYRSPNDIGGDGTATEQNTYRNLWGLLTRRNRQRNQPRWKVFTRRGLQVMMVVYIVVGFVLIKFVFSPNFAFLIGFILIMFFLFTLLFLVDCEA